MAPARVLVIEDDADVREALAEALRGAGIEPVLAGDGLEGLDVLTAGVSPRVILLDHRMPRMAGDAFLRAIRADARWDAIPVISMSAGPGVLEEPVYARLHKPFDLDDLLGVVLSLCDDAIA